MKWKLHMFTAISFDFLQLILSVTFSVCTIKEKREAVRTGWVKEERQAGKETERTQDAKKEKLEKGVLEERQVG